MVYAVTQLEHICTASDGTVGTVGTVVSLIPFARELVYMCSNTVKHMYTSLFRPATIANNRPDRPDRPDLMMDEPSLVNRRLTQRTDSIG